MALIDDPPKPLRDVQLDGVLLTLARIMGVVRIAAGLILAATYFQTWQVIAGVPWILPNRPRYGDDVLLWKGAFALMVVGMGLQFIGTVLSP